MRSNIARFGGDPEKVCSFNCTSSVFDRHISRSLFLVFLLGQAVSHFSWNAFLKTLLSMLSFFNLA